jgi:RNA polymerase sigma factor (sigma-70 family)
MAEYTPSAASFAKLLEWLSPDRDQGAARYEDIRRKLIRFFVCRGCAEPEDLADTTIDRVNRAIDQPSFQYVGDPTLYFYGVAKKVRLEYIRREARIPESIPPTDNSLPDWRLGEVLERCLSSLPPSDRQLLLDYYDYEPGEKGSRRQRLAEQLDIPMNALRIRLHRLRNRLRNCIAIRGQDASLQ